MKNEWKNIGDRIAEIRRAAKLNQAEFAATTGLNSQSAISAIENGDRLPTTEQLITIADKFKVSLDWLVSGIAIPNNNGFEVAESQADYRSLTLDEEYLLKVLSNHPNIKLVIEAMIQLPERKQIIQLGKMLEDLEKIEEGKG